MDVAKAVDVASGLRDAKKKSLSKSTSLISTLLEQHDSSYKEAELSLERLRLLEDINAKVERLDELGVTVRTNVRIRV